MHLVIVTGRSTASYAVLAQYKPVPRHESGFSVLPCGVRKVGSLSAAFDGKKNGCDARATRLLLS